MTSQFRISNSGQTPIYDVKRQCSVRRLETEGGHVEWYAKPMALMVRDSHESIPVLNPGETTSTRIPLPIVGITNGDVEIVVDYTVAIIHTHQVRRFRFVTGRSQNNEIIWFHKSLSE
jgi:hypothetical protein